MADFDNINENFDTIKTLLNSIRAQGILNTSDVDKILEGINSKLEKINTEEDIDLIKAFLTELKQNLDERHNVLISKFGAIEALFSNLLKNSSETLKSSEVKELFDIVATNLSVFSREVVSQKETLTDITLRLDAMRSDDSQKRDIIKNIAVLKGDIERVTNGFDSIVLSLNENFRTVLKTISEINPEESLSGVASQITSIADSSNAILSALQLLDKKQDAYQEGLAGLATQKDLNIAKQSIAELASRNSELVNAVDTLTQKTYKIDSLADKIDASVDIIAGLKSVISDNDEKASLAIIERLNELETAIKQVSNDEEFKNFTSSIDNILREVVGNYILKVDNQGNEIKEHLSNEFDKISQLIDANITRTVSDISSNAETLSSHIQNAQSAMISLCEKSFNEVSGGLSGLKSVIAQFDENNTSSNNAVFSNITDRLAIFENSLKTSLEKQEEFVSNSSNQIIEHISNLKNLAGTFDYKLDSSVVELNSSKQEFEALRSAVQDLLSQDFSNTVSNLKTDLYAIKEELVSYTEASSSEVSEKLINDLYGKYELLTRKLDSVEDEIKQNNTNALVTIKTGIDSISSSIVDILSYVSVSKDANIEAIELKLNDVIKAVKDTNLNSEDDIRNITDDIKNQIEENLRQISSNSDKRAEGIKSVISQNSSDIKDDLKTSYEKLIEVYNCYNEIKETLNVNSLTMSSNVSDVLKSADNIKADFESKLATLKNVLLEKINEFKNEFACDNAEKISELKFNAESLNAKTSQQATDLKNELKEEIEHIIDTLKLNITTLSEDVAKTSLNIESKSNDVVNYIKNDFTSTVNNSVDSIKNNTADILSEMDTKVSNVISGFNSLEVSVNNLTSETKESLTSTLTKILENFVSLKTLLTNMQETSSQDFVNKFSVLRNDFNDLRANFAEAAKDIDEDMSRQITIIEGQFDALNSFLSDLMDSAGLALRERINEELGGASEKLGLSLAEQLETYKAQIENIFDSVKCKNDEQAEFIKQQALTLNSVLEGTLEKQNNDYFLKLQEIATDLNNVLSKNIELTSVDYQSLKDRLSDYTDELAKCNNNLVDSIRAQLDDITKFFNTNIDLHAQETDACLENVHSMLNRLNADVNGLNQTTTEQISKIDNSINTNVKPVLNVIGEKLEWISNFASKELIETTREESASIISANAEIAAGELQTIENYANRILEQMDAVKQNSILCKDIINKLIQEQFNIISKDIEKETDVIVADLIEQATLLKDANKDELTAMSSAIEGTISGYIIDAINDLKNYLDIKTDSTLQNNKIDNLRKQLEEYAEDTTANINKLLGANAFSGAISDLKAANEILISSMAEKMNKSIQEFILSNVSNKLENKLNVFDKKFIDTIVDKYEEIKLLSNQYNSAFEKISISVSELASNFDEIKKDIKTNIIETKNSVNSSITELKDSFEELKAQIMNKSFDEAFHESVHNQILGIETLVSQQLDYLEDISDLCVNNLPEVTELNSIVKYGIQKSIEDLTNKLAEQYDSAENDTQKLVDELNSVKSDIITQFLSIFNQISFVAEQEEIIEYIQEKHDNLIEILSKIETNTEAKVNSIKNDISQINEKISAIISSQGDVDYIYSLQDLELDIANLRLVLNEMNENNKTKDFEELISSTNNIYSLLETIKDELPKLNTDEFRKDFDNLTEDIVSISTRTNKLILASDESYKTLQDNLQDFKLVINDLDERTRNFARESGLDRIDNKLGTLNTMVQNGAKTNQVFNQVFEYLAEWVDKAGAQIEAISDKVETLDDIGQIKVMLEDIKAEAEDNTESSELVEALGKIFDKQAKKITSLEAKLDKIIVENTINKKNNKIDMSPLENTLNSFLVAIDEKMSSQQDKIKALESKLEEVVSLVDNKDTVQLTKKVGGMDKQLAKLNKSIEKIASNVVEK